MLKGSGSDIVNNVSLDIIAFMSYRIEREKEREREGKACRETVQLYIFEIWTLFIFIDSIYFIIGIVFW